MTHAPYSKSSKAVQQLCVTNRLKFKFLFAENSPFCQSSQISPLMSNLDICSTFEDAQEYIQNGMKSKSVLRTQFFFVTVATFTLSFWD